MVKIFLDAIITNGKPKQLALYAEKLGNILVLLILP
jgi:hypothetical protein